MAPVSPPPCHGGAPSPRSVPIESGWRRRTALACAVLGLMIVVAGGASLDWSDEPAMALGQLAGMMAPLILIGAAGWAIAAVFARRP